MSKLANFFERYRVALVTSDINELSLAYDDRFLVSGDSGQRYMKNNRAFKSMLKMSDKFYKKVGVNNVKISHFGCSVMDKHHAGVQIEWQLLDIDGKELIRHNVSYIVYVDRKGIRIIFFVSHNEEERWQAQGYL